MVRCPVGLSTLWPRIAYWPPQPVAFRATRRYAGAMRFLCVVLCALPLASHAAKPIDTRLHAALLSAPTVVAQCTRHGRRISRKALEAEILRVLPGARRDAPIAVEVASKGKEPCGFEVVTHRDQDHVWARVTTPLHIDDSLDVVVSGHVSALPKRLGAWAPYVHAWCVGVDGISSRRVLGMRPKEFKALPPAVRRFVCRDLDPPEEPQPNP